MGFDYLAFREQDTDRIFTADEMNDIEECIKDRIREGLPLNSFEQCFLYDVIGEVDCDLIEILLSGNIRQVGIYKIDNRYFAMDYNYSIADGFIPEATRTLVEVEPRVIKVQKWIPKGEEDDSMFLPKEGLI